MRDRVPSIETATIESRCRLSYTWRYETADGSPAAHASADEPTFATQADAESWIGENWEELLADGVDQVSLLEDDRVVYAGMSLHPAE